jgi:hypothetical protein
MYINRIYVDQVALAWSLADSVRQPRSLRESVSRRRTRRMGATGGNPLTRLARRMLTPKSYFGSRYR